MPTFFADPPQWLYLLLGGLLLVTGVLAAQKQDRRTAIAFGIAFLLMMLVFLIDRMCESPREEAIRRTHMIAMAADAKNPDAFAEHLADEVTIYTFAAQQGKKLTREELKNHPFWGLLRTWRAKIEVSGFAREDVTEINDNAIEIGFVGKGAPEGGTMMPFYLRATFTKQPDGSFKLTAVRVYEFLDRNKLANVPGFP
jgi:hypothetical protein